MIHRLEQDGFLGGSESAQVVFCIVYTSTSHLTSI
jgi:hypothetical protein